MTKPVALVIDDSLTARMKTKEILEADGFDVLVAASGDEGTALAIEKLPDVILLDVVLPGVDGIELCRQWRSNPHLEEIPVMLISGERSDRDDRVEGIQAGAMGYVVKPFNVKEMLAQVHLLYRLQQTHKELKRQALLAVSASSTKSRFLANMSHEIRTPLTSILGYAESLLDEDLDEAERVDGLRTILRNGMHLLTVINDILDISKIEAGKMTIEQIECAYLHIVSDVATLVSQRAAEKGIGFGVEKVYPLPSRITTDPTRFKQILLNLFGNAIKFTQVGKVTARVSCDMVGQRLVVEVIDTGIGMTPEQSSKLFQAFSQADDSTVRQFGGTGLGLFISKDLAEKLDGTITFTSEAGVGSIFRVEIATGDLKNSVILNADSDFPTNPFTVGTSSSRRKFKGRVLVVEDEEDIRKLLLAILRKVGLAPDTACNGRQGMEKALEQPYDLIFSDVQMPVMDGYTFTRNLRAKNYQHPIVALTGNAMESEVRKVLEIGCNEHLAKPFDKASLLEILGRYLEESSPENESSLPLEFAPIVKDSADVVREVIEVVLAEPERVQVTIRYIKSLGPRFEALRKLLESQQWDELADEAHKLAGGGGIFGFIDLHRVTSSLETAARAKDEEQCIRLCAELPKIESDAHATKRVLQGMDMYHQ